jgi:gliotoxin/aspirochlorine biosynthesis thioredoxin reductase
VLAVDGCAPAPLAVDGCAPAPLAVHLAETAASLSRVVTIYTHGSIELADQLTAMLKEPFHVDSRKIRRFVPTKDCVTLEFSDGSSKDETFLVHNPLTVPKGPFVKQLGLVMTPMGDIQADPPFHQTSERGVFAAGDIITPYKVVPGAISSGCNAAVAASAQLGAERWQHEPLL